MGIQAITIVQQIHSQALIYRDIKPENFLIHRTGDLNQIFIVDFGIAKYYLVEPTAKDDEEEETQIVSAGKKKTVLPLSKRTQHKALKDGQTLTGTPRYASLNNHLGLS